MLCGAHANLVASAMFFTGMAANPQLGALAREQFDVRWDWLTWLQGSWLPGLVSMALAAVVLVPALPARSDATAARRSRRRRPSCARWARGRGGRSALGAAARRRWSSAWATEPWHGVHSTGVALAGLAAILVLGIDAGTDIAGDRGAWDALIWLGGLVTMAERLETEGVIDWFADAMAGAGRRLTPA